MRVSCLNVDLDPVCRLYLRVVEVLYNAGLVRALGDVLAAREDHKLIPTDPPEPYCARVRALCVRARL